MTDIKPARVRFAPSPTKRIALPATEPGTIARWSWGWRTYVGAVVAAALVLAVLWRVPALRSPSGQSVNMLTVETPDAEEFMTEVALLVDNPLPAVYEDISAETIAGVDEELMEFVVPSAEDEPLTQNDGKRGVSLC